MKNFNTNQTRHFYVAGAVKSNVENNLDIALAKTETGELFFKYKNADGIVTRSDTIDPKKVVCLKNTVSEAMARKLMAHTIAVDSDAVTLSDLVGKTVDCIITINGLFDYDAANSCTFVASVRGTAANTASPAAFHKDLAIAIAKALPKYDPQYPLIRVYSNGTEVTANTPATDVTGAAAGVVLVEGPQKYVRGKLSGEPCQFTVAFRYAASNVEDVVWGKETIAPSEITGMTVIPANYELADLEYFALGERGDYYRGATWPNNYEPTYAIDITGETSYNVLSIDYFWSGEAENVQRSPRLIQVAGPVAVINELYNKVYEAMNPSSAASGGD